MAKSPEEQEASMIANLKEKTGKSLDQWLKVARAAKLEKHGELVKHLKSDHGLTHGYANLVAHKTFKSDAGSAASEDDLIAQQYAGDKAALRPIYDALIAKVKKFGKDVEAAPKKTYVSLRRNKQFALIQPTTKTRIDVGLNLKDAKPTARLEKSGSFNAMVTHRVRVSEKKDIDRELVEWLRSAYEAS